jgi:hypothetical protein
MPLLGSARLTIENEPQLIEAISFCHVIHGNQAKKLLIQLSNLNEQSEPAQYVSMPCDH